MQGRQCRQNVGPMLNPHPNVVLLTATITAPPDARNLARREQHLRLQDYLEAFDFYLDLLARDAVDALVLCDNSAHDLSLFAARAADAGLHERVELLSHFGLDYPARYGRGFGEFKLVDHAMHASALIAAAGPEVRIWKVTGRYQIRNLRQLIRSRPAHADLYCHCRNHPMPWLDMYVMSWNLRAYRGLIRGVYQRLRQDATPISAEQRFRAIVDSHEAPLRVVRRFCHVPNVVGVRGFDNRPYGAMWHKHAARAIAHRLTPWIWI
jgi:hypothetical protein